MFDKLIESDTEGAEFKNRSRYFTVSTLVVGTLFLSAVMYSLYAAEIGIGAANFELAELVAPLETAEPEPKQEQEQEVSRRSEQSELPVRTNNVARPDEFQYVPDKPSSEVSKFPPRPVGKYIFDPNGIDSIGSGPGGSTNRGTAVPTGSSSANLPDDDDKIDTTPPPVVKVKQPTTIMRTSNVLNGIATFLPKPTYPRPAIVLNLEGTVKVQVTIDENGNVVSARAAEGHPLLRGVSEQAARGAKFKPTTLNGVPVKVTGIITYNFKKPN